jgi:hypothetical protein
MNCVNDYYNEFKKFTDIFMFQILNFPIFPISYSKDL